ncbi:MAG: endonuclease III domain-containing protein [Gammaproteobacteria bacterium]|nr:endonuclease III domain-containing protein [Gammaproteobacteria bacterium]
MSYTIRQVYQHLLKHHGSQDWWPGDTPFEIMVGAILTQNTAWSNVEKAIANLKVADCLDAATIVALPHDDLAEMLRPSGYFNIKTRRLQAFCEWLLAQGGEQAVAEYDTEAMRDALLEVYGVGPETADDIVLYAFHRPVFVIDAYTRRIFSRLGIISGDEGYEELRGRFESTLKGKAKLYNEYHALIVMHGKDVCRVKPRCHACVFTDKCSYISKP